MILKSVRIENFKCIEDSKEFSLDPVTCLVGKNEADKLSLGQAAELAGVSKRTFMELPGNYGVSIFNYDAEEIEKDFKNV